MEEILRAILVVSMDRKIASIFKELQFKKIQIAVVVDQKVVGLLSMEDILEEIVGEILDEYDAGWLTAVSQDLWRHSVVGK